MGEYPPIFEEAAIFGDSPSIVCPVDAFFVCSAGMPAFVPGLELARAYWFDIVAPILDPQLAGSDRAAALISGGSDVLGFDTEQSTDHGWGPRVFVFLRDDVDRDVVRSLARELNDALPDTFRGYPTRFAARDDEPIRHQVSLTTVTELADTVLGFDPRSPITPQDWLKTPTQRLRSLTKGAVFEDGPGDLTEIRENLAWYPHDIWIYVLGCQWRRLAQEEPFVGRCGQVGDDLGSAIVTARLIRDLMRLCFLIEREYAPYSKWLGTAFSQLDCAPELVPTLIAALRASGWPERERHLTVAFETVAANFNALGVTSPIEPNIRPFYNRPFLVLDSDRFADACMAITPFRNLGFVGSIDQFVDSTDVLSYPSRVTQLAQSIWGL
jgi:hypothetical protein